MYVLYQSQRFQLLHVIVPHTNQAEELCACGWGRPWPLWTGSWYLMYHRPYVWGMLQLHFFTHHRRRELHVWWPSQLNYCNFSAHTGLLVDWKNQPMNDDHLSCRKTGNGSSQSVFVVTDYISRSNNLLLMTTGCTEPVGSYTPHYLWKITSSVFFFYLADFIRDSSISVFCSIPKLQKSMSFKFFAR